MRCFCTKTKTYHCKVVLLDDQELLQEILNTSTGQDVLDTVFRHLNLIETSYFGLRYVDCNNQTHWLDTTKKIAKQLKGKDSFTLYFGVKFYAADPCKLVEEITRYQFFLQVKQDILQGRLPASFELLAELGAYAVQSELGDYDPRRHGPGYISEFRFVSNQSVELENKIAELHKELQGQLPAVAELNYLDKVKWLEMYGVDLHPVIGEDSVEYFLGLSPSGVIVLRNKSKVASYYWSRIKKIYFKGKYFMLRVTDKNSEENTFGFETPSRAACKHLYKCCKEHHSFFQLVHVSTNAPDVVSTRFSSGRTDKFSGRSSQLGIRNPPTFVRTPSRRYQRRIVEGASEDSKVEDKLSVKENTVTPDDTKNIYVMSSSNNSTYYPNRSDSPRSTRSAPWNVWSTSGPPRPAHSSHSPRSVRSAGPQLRLTRARRSSSVESQSSNDSRPCRRHKHRSKRASDNESELSRCSSHGHSSHRRHRHRSRRSSGSEQEYHHHGHHSSRNRYQLIDSEGQWKEVQRRQAEGSTGIQEATVVRPRSGYTNSGIETESEHSSCHHHRRKHRKHRSRSRSPSESSSKSHLPDELKKHLEFQLIDTEGMSEDQLREIPYTVVKTNAAKAVRVRLSSSGKPKAHSTRRAKNELSSKESPGAAAAYNEDSPPPPYSESPVLSDLSNKTTSTSTTAGTTTSDSHKQTATSQHVSRLPSHIIRSNNNVNQKSSCSTLYDSPPATQFGHTKYTPSTNHLKDPAIDNNAWLSENAKFSNLGFVVGLPPQPHSRRSYNNGNSQSHSDLTLNAGRSQNQKPWPSPEIRGTVGLPWSSLSEQVQSPSVNSLYAGLEAGGDGRRLAAASVDLNNVHQTMAEHRSMSGGGSFRSGGIMKTDPQSASTPTLPNICRENEKIKRQHTPAESGVLRSHTITPNGKMAWPNERQFGWQPTKSTERLSSNVNQSQPSWTNNVSPNWANGGAAADYSQWNGGGGGGGIMTMSNGCCPPTSTAATNSSPQFWHTPPPPPPSSQNVYRDVDRGPLLFSSSQPQMQRINENVFAETSSDFNNYVNNNETCLVDFSNSSPNNNYSSTKMNNLNESTVYASFEKSHTNCTINGFKSSNLAAGSNDTNNNQNRYVQYTNEKKSHEVRTGL